MQSIEHRYATLDEAAAVYRMVYQLNKMVALGISLKHGEDTFPSRSDLIGAQILVLDLGT